MPTPCSALLDGITLTAGLTSVLNGAGTAVGPVIVVDQQQNSYESRSRSDIVTCRLATGRELRLLCKYDDIDEEPEGNVAYEIEVYRQILRPLQLSLPAYHGAHRERGTGRMWLIIEYLEGSQALDEEWAPSRMPLAARWLGQFHAAMDARFAGNWPPFLKVYDTDYYLQRVRRALRTAVDLPDSFSWLTALGERFESFVFPFLEQKRTVAHGDFYPHNLLWHAGAIYPIDWELSGLDLGEMDLACLTDGWPEATEQRCVREYCRARWPEGAPADFAQSLAAAQLCLWFYNLAERLEWPNDPQGRWYGERLRLLGARLGLI